MKTEESDYELLDSGNGRKVERFGEYILIRPCSQAVWKPLFPEPFWNEKADASFSRDEKKGWSCRTGFSKSWQPAFFGQKMALEVTDFGHIGLFPEHMHHWSVARDLLSKAASSRREAPRVLNLFAYSGGMTLACAAAGAHVCHVDASKGMVDWARKNSALNGLEQRPIRWIVEDVMKFCKREEKRGSLYDAIILDPPSFGRGAKGEVFKIEEEIHELLQQVVRLLSPQPIFLLFTCHTQGFSPTTMRYLMEDALKVRSDLKEEQKQLETGEMLVASATARPIPSGTYAFLKIEAV